MEADGEDFGVALEVVVEGKDGGVETFGDGADEHVDGRALNPAPRAEIREFRRSLEVERGKRDVVEAPQTGSQGEKLLLTLNARQKLLANRADEQGFVERYEAPQLEELASRSG